MFPLSLADPMTPNSDKSTFSAEASLSEWVVNLNPISEVSAWMCQCHKPFILPLTTRAQCYQNYDLTLISEIIFNLKNTIVNLISAS